MARMSKFSAELVKAARFRLERPFYDHYEDGDDCHHGRVTRPSCMARGLDDRGYDCSGLAIACLSDVLGIEVRRWPSRFRHLTQLARIAVNAAPEASDIVILSAKHPQGGASPGHMGISTGPESLIHASRACGGRVVEGSLLSRNYLKLITVIPHTHFEEVITESDREQASTPCVYPQERLLHQKGRRVSA